MLKVAYDKFLLKNGEGLDKQVPGQTDKKSCREFPGSFPCQFRGYFVT